jgi:preprotein translocase subunit SecE
MAEAVARPAGSGGTGGSGGTTGTGGGSHPSFLSRMVAFYHGVMAEMRKVTWPDLGQVRSATIAIIIFVLILGLVITILDFVLQGILIKLIPSLFAGR